MDLRMIDFAELLSQAEGDALDFKATPYSLTDPESNAAMVKDVVCMANTPRDVESYVVTGVKKYPDGRYDLIGVNAHPDDADVQAAFADRIYPPPKVFYDVVTHKGLQFGLYRIPPEKLGPCVAMKDFGQLRQWQIYFRRNSRNTPANPADQKAIYGWFGKSASLPHNTYDNEVPAWQQVVELTHSFDPSYRFVLIASPGLIGTAEHLKSLGLPPWSAVFDFDPNTDNNGLFAAVRDTLTVRRSVYLSTLNDPVPTSTGSATDWCVPRGLVGRPDTVKTGKWLDWKRAVGSSLSGRVEHLASLLTPAPVIVIALWEDAALIRHLQSLLESFVSSFAESATLLICSSNAEEYVPLAVELDAKAIAITPFHFASGLGGLYGGINEGVDAVQLPSSSGAPVTFGIQEQRWLEEQLELVGTTSGLAPRDGRDVGRDFLRGSEITWYELGLHYDIDRDVLSSLQHQIERDLESRKATRTNLYHGPGAGGTTLGRRVLWNLHLRYPVLIIRAVEPRSTMERLSRIASLTALPVIALVDGAAVSTRSMDELYDLIRSQQSTIVLLQVLRRFIQPTTGPRTYYLASQLSDPEVERFAHIYGRANPGRQVAVKQLATAAEKQHRTAFYFGLQTFLDEFKGLSTFVGEHLAQCNAIQQKILAFLAIAHHYAQKPIPGQVFASLIGTPPNKSINITDVLQQSTELLIRAGDNTWRTSHELIAMELLKRILSPRSTDPRLWKQNLSSWALDFAQVCRGSGTIISEEMVELIRRAFFYRDNTDLLGTERSASKQFSELIEDIPSREGRLEVLRRVTEMFDTEPHFWAHLGRFYGLEMKDHANAGRCIDRAITLNPVDPTLHHMRGMSYRYQLYQMIEESEPLAEILSLAEKASESFSEARALNPDDDHGYISEVQMLIRVVSYAGKLQGDGDVVRYLTLPTSSPFLQDSLERAEGLLESVRRRREGESPNPYEADCRAKVDVIYGRHDRALQLWDQLLSRSDVFGPPIRRQIVWTYLARRNRNWNALATREIDRTISLLEQNLMQEPENDANLRLWIQAVRRASYPITLAAMIEKVANWRARSASLDSTYYLYVLYSLQAFDNVPQSSELALRFLEESRAMSRYRRDRTKSFEWLGRGTGARRLVHHSQLGDWNFGVEFWENTTPLERVEGRISRIEGNQAGQVELPTGLTAFFVPARGGFTSRHLNQMINFYLGFSFDGLRAWSVREGPMGGAGKPVR